MDVHVEKHLLRSIGAQITESRGAIIVFSSRFLGISAHLCQKTDASAT